MAQLNDLLVMGQSTQLGHISTPSSINAGAGLSISQTAGSGVGLNLYGGNTGTTPTYGILFGTTSNFGKFGDVQSDWATYFTMNATGQRGWVYRAGSTNVASISANGIGAFNGLMKNTAHILAPQGGHYTTTTSTLTGYLKITLPVSWTNAMFRFVVDIYDYTADNAVTYIIGGYNYSADPGWHQTSAQCISKWGSSKSNLTVRFGHDGSKCAIYIGETNTTWSYPQVIVRDVVLGYGQASTIDTWSKNWSIGFTTSLGSNITTKTNTNIGYCINSSLYPAGFKENGGNITWGTLQGTQTTTSGSSYQTIARWDSPNGGSVAFADGPMDNNTKKAQTSMQIDGYYYQSEGAYQVLDNRYMENATASPSGSGTATGYVNIKTRLVVRGNGSSYNEGIRILPASNGWSNIFFSATDTLYSTHQGGWLIGRRGAVGSVGDTGDFTIEENNSTGASLTIHKNTYNSSGTLIGYGGATLTGRMKASSFYADLNYSANYNNSSWVSGLTSGAYTVRQAPQNSSMTSWLCHKMYNGSGLSIGSLNNSTNLYFTWQNADNVSNNINDTGNSSHPLVRNQMYWDPVNNKLHCGAFNATSDARLKTNLESYAPQQSILDLPIYKFDFTTGAKNQIGCMAQDLQKICPEIVDLGEDGYLSIQESKIVYLLIDEIKKLKEEIILLKEKK